MTIDTVPQTPVANNAGAQRPNTNANASAKAKAAADALPGNFQNLLSGLAASEVAVAGADGMPGQDAAAADGPLATPSARKKAALAALQEDVAVPDPALLVANAPMQPMPTIASPLAGGGVDMAGLAAVQASGLSLADSTAGPGSTLVDTPSVPTTPVAAVGSELAVSPASLANYASVFEQIRSRADTGDALPQEGVLGQDFVPKEGFGKVVTAGNAIGIRASRAPDTATALAWSLPAAAASAAQTVADMAQELQAAAQDKPSAAGASDAKLPEGPVLHLFTPTVQFDASSTTLGASPVAPEAAVAEQVSYWIAQGIRNAELTLDGAGNQPVEVSIALSGNSAHVEFRTDQPEARELLSGAATHLKELLQQEGLVLSGVSVGSPDAGGAGQRERKEAQDMPQNAAGSAKVGASANAKGAERAPIANGRAVDYFV